jgi:hypothetical protein
MIILEGKRRKNWYDYILDHLASDDAFDLLFNIFDGVSHAEGPLLSQAVAELKKYLPSVPVSELKRYAVSWVEHHRDLLSGRGY